MPRTVSSEVRTLLDSSYAETYDIVDIILPLRAGETEVDRISYYIAKSSGIEYNSNEYLPALRSINSIKFSLGKASDSSEISIENVSQTFGAIISDSTRTLDGAAVTITRLFVVSSGYEGYVLFNGYVRESKVTQDFVTLNLVSDMSRRNSQVASRAITQRCIWTFRGVECGWTPDQVGDPTMCNKVFDDPLGCSGHANQPRFGGVPTLSPKAQEIVGNLGNGWGESGGGGPTANWRFDVDYPFGSRGVMFGFDRNSIS